MAQNDTRARVIREGQSFFDPYRTPWIETFAFDIKEHSFDISVNLEDVASEPGIYTIMLWGIVDGYSVPVAEYSIFHQTDAPTAYQGERGN